MKRFARLKGSWSRARVSSVAWGVLLLIGGSACTSIPGIYVKRAEPYQPENVFMRSSDAFSGYRRVAILPVTIRHPTEVRRQGRRVLEEVFMQEWTQAGHFEVRRLSRDELRHISGRAEWSTQDTLPADFLQSIKKATESDAVLFVELTEYQPYFPIVIGWRLALVDLGTSRIVWAADELFDGGRPDVAAAARFFAERHFYEPSRYPDSDFILKSPRQFGHYTVAALAGSIPYGKKAEFLGKVSKVAVDE